jgi:copper homeostasis protein CutC
MAKKNNNKINPQKTGYQYKLPGLVFGSYQEEKNMDKGRMRTKVSLANYKLKKITYHY